MNKNNLVKEIVIFLGLSEIKSAHQGIHSALEDLKKELKPNPETEMTHGDWEMLAFHDGNCRIREMAFIELAHRAETLEECKNIFWRLRANSPEIPNLIRKIGRMLQERRCAKKTRKRSLKR